MLMGESRGRCRPSTRPNSGVTPTRFPANPTYPGARVSELGAVLRSARQKRNLSLADVAAATHIKEQYLEALEDGEYGVLPGPAYVTGFLRNYGRFLGLHPDDLIQDFYTTRSMPGPSVKPATRVLASGYERQNRKRLLWGFVMVAVMLVGGYTVKQYREGEAHASASQLNVTPANLGSGYNAARTHKHQQPTLIRLQLRATQPVWTKVTVDGVKKYQGVLRPRAGLRTWTGHTAIYVASYDGRHLRVRLNGRPLGAMSTQPGLQVDQATASGWHAAL
jgi:transcriptional regulator with XRE-family HTH domain